MTLDEFTAAFPGESQYVEWKEGTSGKPLQKAIVAFSNADGGVVMVGVNDRGKPIGRRLDEGARKTLWETINEIESPGPIEISGLEVGGVPITIISVDRRQEGVSQTSDGTPVIRRGKQNLPLKGDSLIELLSQRSHAVFEGSPTDWSLSDADPDLRTRLCEALEMPLDLHDQDFSDALAERGLIVRQGGKAMLTKAGALFLVPSAPRQFGKCYIEVFRFPQEDAEHDLRKEFRGTPAQQADDAITWIDEQLGFDFVVVRNKRHDLKRLPYKALREVIANAVAHRDYQLSGSAIEVHLKPQEVVVISPGGFVAPVTSRNIREAHSARNRTVIRTLRGFDLGEDAGRGIKVILEEMASDLRKEPSFEEEIDGFVTVRLPIEGPVTPDERAWVHEMEEGGQLRPDDRRVLIEAARGVTLSNSAVCSLLNVDSTHARQSLQRLRDAGFLEQDGQRGGARYRIAPNMNQRAAVRLNRAEIREVILRMAANRRITNAVLRNELGLSHYEVGVQLKELVADGLLERRGSSRSTHYVLAPGASE